MALADSIFTQIQKLTGDLISCGLSSDQNFPAMKNTISGDTITFSGEEDLSITLKNINYAEMYDELKAKRQFNIQLIDGALVQIQYIVENDEIKKHRLCFFPSVDLSEYQNNSEIYECDEIYADVLAKNIVGSPIRFDFDPQNFLEDAHPMSHMTIGQYKNCRIAVGGPLSPYLFIHFILKSFYNTALNLHSNSITEFEHAFGMTITEVERRTLHLMTPALKP